MTTKSEAFVTFVLGMLLMIGLALVQAWAVMLLVGAWHSERPAVPPISFLEAWLVCIIANIITWRPTGGSE